MREHIIDEENEDYVKEPRPDLIEVGKKENKIKYKRTFDGFTGLCFDSNGLCIRVKND